jgi:hypothetical protein
MEITPVFNSWYLHINHVETTNCRDIMQTTNFKEFMMSTTHNKQAAKRLFTFSLLMSIILLYVYMFRFSTTIRLDYFRLFPESSYHHGSLNLSGIIIAGNLKSPWIVMLPIFPENCQGLCEGGITCGRSR